MTALLLAVAASGAADTLADMRVALGHLAAKSPIRARYSVHRTRKSQGRFVNDDFTGDVAVEVQSDEQGFRIVLSEAVLATIAREKGAKLRDDAAETPTLNALWEVTPVTTSEAVDSGPPLLQMIAGAKLVSDRAALVNGKPGRVIVLDLAQAKKAARAIDIGKVTVEEDRVTIWTGEDALPEIAEHVRRVKASLLLIKAETSNTEKWIFARSDDRLLRLRYESSSSGSGFGQKGSGSITAILTPHR